MLDTKFIQSLQILIYKKYVLYSLLKNQIHKFLQRILNTSKGLSQIHVSAQLEVHTTRLYIYNLE